jgi:hypothetical protein
MWEEEQNCGGGETNREFHSIFKCDDWWWMVKITTLIFIHQFKWGRWMVWFIIKRLKKKVEQKYSPIFNLLILERLLPSEKNLFFNWKIHLYFNLFYFRHYISKILFYISNFYWLFSPIFALTNEKVTCFLIFPSIFSYFPLPRAKVHCLPICQWILIVLCKY